MADVTDSDAGAPVDAWRAWRSSLPQLHPWAAMERLVVVSVDPDDATLGAGGLMAQAARAEVDVELVDVTGGGAAHAAPTAMARHRLDLPRGAVGAHREELLAALERVVGRGKGLWIACPLAGSGDADHDVVGEVVTALARDAGVAVLEFPGSDWRWADPSEPPGGEWRRIGLDAPARVAKREAVARLGAPEGGGAGTWRDEIFRLTAPSEPPHPLEEVHEADDPWGVDRYFYESRKRALTLAALPAARYRRALEVGCSIGALAAELASRCDEVLAVDLSERAVEAATQRLQGIPGATVARLRVPHQWPEGDFDLVVVSEMGYFLTPEELGGLADRIDASLAPDGAVVLCHWLHPIEGWFLQGHEVHDAFAADERFEVLVRHREPDFLLDVLQRPGRPSPARLEGLV